MRPFAVSLASGPLTTASQGMVKSAQRPASGLQTVAVLLALVAGLLLAQPAAAQSCTMSSPILSPSGPLKIPSTATKANEVLLLLNFQANWTCTSGSTGNTVRIIPPGRNSPPDITPIAGATNLSWTRGYSSTAQGPMFTSVSVTSGPCTTAGSLLSQSFQFTGTASVTTPCTGIAFAKYAILSTAAGAVAGPLPASLTAASGFSNGWLNMTVCTGWPTCSGGGAFIAVISLAAPVTLTTTANTCTLIGPAARTVLLPTVSRSSFTGVGSTSGATLFSVSVNCPVAGAVGLQFGLLYASPAVSGVQQSYLTNTAASPAGGVNVVFRTTSGTALQSGSVVSITPSVAAGTNTMDMVVSYLQTSATVTAGAVQSVATYTFTYY